VYDYCQARFERAGFQPQTLPEPPDHHILLGLIAEGRGVGLISHSLTRLRHKDVVFRPLRDAGDLRMGIAFVYDETNGSPALRELIALVRTAVLKAGETEDRHNHGR
jgi:DNA-binding transcriptional LysR family regulator